jgi:beta-phosphoglucomutase-like phosphatase (HAD superfamily)
VQGWLEKLGIYHRFAGVFTRTDGYPVKPDPALFEAAQQCMGLAKEQCLIIEDSENGTIAAQNAAIPCVAIPNRMTESSDFSRAAHRCASLRELLQLLKSAR